MSVRRAWQPVVDGLEARALLNAPGQWWNDASVSAQGLVGTSDDNMFGVIGEEITIHAENGEFDPEVASVEIHPGGTLLTDDMPQSGLKAFSVRPAPDVVTIPGGIANGNDANYTVWLPPTPGAGTIKVVVHYKDGYVPDEYHNIRYTVEAPTVNDFSAEIGAYTFGPQIFDNANWIGWFAPGANGSINTGGAVFSFDVTSPPHLGGMYGVVQMARSSDAGTPFAYVELLDGRKSTSVVPSGDFVDGATRSNNVWQGSTLKTVAAGQDGIFGRVFNDAPMLAAPLSTQWTGPYYYRIDSALKFDAYLQFVATPGSIPVAISTFPWEIHGKATYRGSRTPTGVEAQLLQQHQRDVTWWDRSASGATNAEGSPIFKILTWTASMQTALGANTQDSTGTTIVWRQQNDAHAPARRGLVRHALAGGVAPASSVLGAHPAPGRVGVFRHHRV